MYRWMIGFALAITWAVLVLFIADSTTFFENFFRPDFRILFLVPALIMLFVFSGVSARPRVSLAVVAVIAWFVSLHALTLLLPSGMYMQGNPLLGWKILGVVVLHYAAFIVLMRESRGLREANKRKYEERDQQIS